jgi:hypothetical protein
MLANLLPHPTLSETLDLPLLFLTGLHKVHPAYRMVNAGWVGGRASLIGYLLSDFSTFFTKVLWLLNWEKLQTFQLNWEKSILL